MIYQDETEPSLVLARKIRSYLESNGLASNLTDVSYEILALQLIDSKRLAQYLNAIANREMSINRIAPKQPLFDPIKAVLLLKEEEYDEACWLSFLIIYTDDSFLNDWAFMRQLYGGAELVERLTWREVNNNPEILPRLANALATQYPKPKFGHHRAYESLTQLPIVFESYLEFIRSYDGHHNLFKPFDKIEKEERFKTLYTLVRQNVSRFGRLSTFEFLCLLGKTGLATISPDSCYIADASGPKRGAKLLFGQLTNTALDEHAKALAESLDIGYQEMEAALCHWQKSPNAFVRHKG